MIAIGLAHLALFLPRFETALAHHEPPPSRMLDLTAGLRAGTANQDDVLRTARYDALRMKLENKGPEDFRHHGPAVGRFLCKVALMRA